MDMDEFEIEITPLDGADEGNGDGETPGPRWIGSSEALSPFAPRLTRRRKLLRTATTWGAVLLACLLISVISPPLRSMLGRLLRTTPVGNVTAQSGSETIYFEHTVPWGKLSIDGRRISPPADTSTDSIAVAPGHHTLVYNAPPFAPLRCHFQVPISTLDDCPLEFAPPAPSAQSRLYVRIIDLRATPNRLPEDQMIALSSVIDTALGALASQTYIPAGSTYLAPDGEAATTAQSLIATLAFRLNMDSHVVVPYLPGGIFCSQICYLGDTSATLGSWGILAVAHVTWNYAQPEGFSVLQGIPASPVPDGSIALVSVDVTWSGSWHAIAVSSQNQFGVSPICEIANDLLPAAPAAGDDQSAYAQTTEIPAPDAADGCLLAIHLNQWPMPEYKALVLYRFGILFAANNDAHQLYPGLPVATPEDQALAQRMATGY